MASNINSTYLIYCLKTGPIRALVQECENGRSEIKFFVIISSSIIIRNIQNFK